MPIPYIFVYGTLKSGFNNPFAKILKEHARFIGEGSFPGRLFRVSWYPAAVFESDSQKQVMGEIYQLVTKPEFVLNELDKYEDISPEDSEYIRTTIDVTLSDGKVISCFVYLFNQATDDLDELENGRFDP
jgi:gamma-glutamylcyclotransferase (GGCT)/AIG2-like uncharacterized protein YtfP